MVLAGLTLLLGAHYCRVHATHPIDPLNPLPAHAWFGWADQGAYYRAALAWASGNLNDAQHHYPAGYSLLAALFVPAFRDEPFFIPDLLCWASSLWIFAALAAELYSSRRGMRAIGGCLFFLTTAVSHKAFYTWEIPWTSTPAATCTLFALLMALRFGNSGRVGAALAAALSAGLVVMFRPTDFIVIATAVGLFLLGTAWRNARGIPPARFVLLCGLAFAIGPALLVITHLATHGLRPGAYVVDAGRIGFEWRLLPLRWVTLLLNPQPLFPAGMGLAEVYWWIMPGIAGIAAALLEDRGHRAQHVLVGATAMAFVCMYLCYRDLHPPGLFVYINQHYFKWTIPVFALYALDLLYLSIVQRRCVPVLAGLGIAVLLGCWRAEMVITPGISAASVLPDGTGLTLPYGLKKLNGAFFAASPDDAVGLYLGQHRLDTKTGTVFANSGFKIFPIPFGFMLVPLRVLPGGPQIVHLATTIRLDPNTPVFAGRQKIVFGIPCSLFSHRPVCRYVNPVHPMP